MKNFILSIIKKLSSQPAVGGLGISDSTIRFLRIDGDKTVTVPLRLPPGIILDGKINDRQNFLSALKTVYSQLAKTKTGTKIQVIVCLPVSVVYSQSFSVPVISKEGLEETIGLNIRMVSPINLENAYSDWQIIGENNNYKDILGAFIENSIVDEYDKCLRESGFLPVAFEYPALSLNRLVKELGPNIESDKSYLVVDVSTDGLNFLIIRKGELYFNHFIFWRTIQGEKRQITFADFRNIFIQEIQKIINFLSTTYKEAFEGVIILAPAMEKEVGEAIQKEFELKIIPLQLKRHAELSAVWFTALGSALRGLLPRRQDIYISLAAHNVIEEFYHEQALAFISRWRNIFIVCLSAFLLVFGGVDMILAHIKNNIGARLSLLTTNYQIEKVNKLQNKAKFFNELVSLVSGAKNSSQKWSPLFEQLNKLAGNNIVFDRISIQSLTTPVRLQARADSQEALMDFKKNIASQPNFEQVDMPLNSIKITPDRRVSFEINFVIKSLTR